MSAKPVFVSGFRSGTTLLINLLGLHPEIAPWFETKAFVEALRWMRVTQDRNVMDFEHSYITPTQPVGFSLDAVDARMRSDYTDTAARLSGHSASGKGKHERYPLGADCIGYAENIALACQDDWYNKLASGHGYEQIARATGVLVETLGHHHQIAMHNSLWINKTPEISRFAFQLRDALGSCRIIYMVRDGESVVASARALGWGEVEQLAFNWRGLLLMTRAAMKQYEEDYLELRYEDLLSSPEQELDRILTFCGLPGEGERIMTDFRQRMGNDALAAPVAGNCRLGTQDKACFEAVAGDLQRELGY